MLSALSGAIVFLSSCVCVQGLQALSEASLTAGECDLCGGSQQWLFIVATGRSGSTTMLEMLNAIPGFYLSGENYGVMDKVMRIYDGRANVSDWARAGDSRFQSKPVSETRLLCSLQLFVKAVLGEFSMDRTEVIGFKEIRHTSPKQRAFWKKVFPCGRFIVNTRKNTTKQHQSQFQKFLSLSSLESYTRDLLRWQAQNSRDVYKLQLEDYSVGNFNKLLSFLGITGCNFTDMAWANKRGTWNSDSTRARVSGRCTMPRWEAIGPASNAPEPPSPS